MKKHSHFRCLHGSLPNCDPMQELNEETRNRILANLVIGMPLGNVADLVRLPLERIQQEMVQYPDFKADVDHAVAECMETQLNKLKELTNWQAVAFILQSLWPAQFGRRSRGARKPRTATSPVAQGEFDPKHLTDAEHDHLKYLLAKAHGRIAQEVRRELSEGNGVIVRVLH
jgi:hypothetical protein